MIRALAIVTLSFCSSGCMIVRDAGGIFDFGVDVIPPCSADRFEIVHLNAKPPGHLIIASGPVNAESREIFYLYDPDKIDFQYMITLYLGDERIAERIYSQQESYSRRFVLAPVRDKCIILS